MITCRELVDFLMDYSDGALAPEERAAFEKHLADCPPCVAYLKTYQQAVCLGKSVCADDDHEVHDVPEELVLAILAARNASNGS